MDFEHFWSMTMYIEGFDSGLFLSHLALKQGSKLWLKDQKYLADMAWNAQIYGKLKNLGNGQGHGGYNRFDASAYHLSYT